MSVGGASVKLPTTRQFAVDDQFRLSFPENVGGSGDIGARVVGIRGSELRLEFSVPTIQEQETLTRALYSRADAWLTSTESKEVDQPLKSLGRVVVLSFHGFNQVIRSLFPEKAPVVKRKALPAATTLVCVLAVGTLLGGSGLQAQSETGSSVAADSSASAANEVEQVIVFKNMGMLHAIDFHGPHSYASTRFVLPNTLVPREATLHLHYSFDSTADGQAGSLKVSLNGSAIATLQAGQSSEGTTTDVEIPANQLVRSNSLTFEYIGGLMVPENQSKVLAHIETDSAIDVKGDPLRLENDLAQLPLPLFDPDLQTATTIPFAFLSQPSPQTLQAAGIAASWFGLLASSNPVRFTASVGDLPKGDVVLISDERSTLPASLLLPAGTGPIVALRGNPSDAFGSVLLIAGDGADQLLTAARTLSLTRKATLSSPAQGLPLKGDTALIPDLIMPAARAAGDAPRWLPLERGARLASCSSREELQTGDSSSIPVYFHIAPDVFYGEKENVKLYLHYRYNSSAIAAGSALRIVVNGELVHETALAVGKGALERASLISVPVAVLQPFGNTVLFNFDFTPANRDAVQAAGAPAMSGEILCDSSLDLHGLAQWARMPNLDLFANAGFPFTRKADLSETTVILPEGASPREIALYLHLMGQFGGHTGYPALRVSVSQPNLTLSKSRDYLVLGSIADQPAFTSLAGALPVTFDGEGLHVKESPSFLATIREDVSNAWSKLVGGPDVSRRPVNDSDVPAAMIEGIESPVARNRSMILISLRSDETAEAFSDAFPGESRSNNVSGTVSLLRRGSFESYELGGQTYQVGTVSWLAMLRMWLGRYFILLLLAVTGLNLVLARWIRDWLSRRAQERLQLVQGSEVVHQ